MIWHSPTRINNFVLLLVVMTRLSRLVTHSCYLFSLCNQNKTPFSHYLFEFQVWDAATGAKQYTFEGHEAPVYSVCPHYKENIQVLLHYLQMSSLY